MYNVMIVEDSKPIMRDIVNRLECLDMWLKIAEIAYNGAEALDKLQDRQIDILLTDIKMPLLDGIALIQEAKKLLPRLQCIIITGYSDFEYARSAIKLQVNEYILKPVETEDLRKALTSVIERVRQNRHAQIHAGLNILMSYREDIQQGGSFLADDTLSVSRFMLIIIRAGLSKKCKGLLDLRIAEQALRSIVDESCFWLLPNGTGYEAAYLLDLSEIQGEEGAAGAKGDTGIRIRKELRKQKDFLCRNGLQVNIIISPEYYDIRKLFSYYNQLSVSLSSQIQIGKPQIFSLEMEERIPLNELNSEVVAFKKKFASLIKNLNISVFMNEFTKSLKEWEEREYPLIFVRRFLAVIVDEANKVFVGEGSGDIIDLTFELEMLLRDCRCFGDVKTNVEGYLKKNCVLAGRKINSTEELMNEISKYMRENIYGTISMTELSERFSVSASYINRMMKSRWKQSPMDYYISLKIKEAKALLCANEDILIREVADLLGFSDQQYFSKVFKAHVGLSPGEFRDQREGLFCERPDMG